MMFSKACEYGIRAVIFISNQTQQGKRTSLKSIAREIHSPEAFTSKILQLLSNENIISSAKGPGGGYQFLHNPKKPITLFHIVKAIDGDKIYNGCGLGLKQCDELKPCPLHDQFKAIREDLKQMLQSTAVFALAEKLTNEKVYLKT